MDGIDVAAIETDGDSELARGPFLSVPYDRERMDRIAAGLREAQSIVHRQDRPGALSALERDLTHWHAEAVRIFLAQHPGDKPDVIGFHGQTLLHRPQDRLTIQVGDGNCSPSSRGSTSSTISAPPTSRREARGRRSFPPTIGHLRPRCRTARPCS